MKAFATRGETGNRLSHGLDLSGGLRIASSASNYKIIKNNKPDKEKWINLMIINILHSKLATLHLLVKYLMDNLNYSVTTHCLFNKAKSVYIIKIGNKEYRAQGQKILDEN